MKLREVEQGKGELSVERAASLKGADVQKGKDEKKGRLVLQDLTEMTHSDGRKAQAAGPPGPKRCIRQ